MIMQKEAISPDLNLSREDLTACPSSGACSACFSGKDFCSADSFTLEAQSPRELFSGRAVGFSPQVPILSYAPSLPSSSIRPVYAPFLLKETTYPGSMFSALPDRRRRSLSLMTETSKESPAHERMSREDHSLQASMSNSAASSSNWLPSSASGSREKPRRMRTVFTPQQLGRLERHFKNQQYVGSAQRIYIAKQLGLSEAQVKVWFQNRRIRWRKQALSSLENSQSPLDSAYNL